MKILVMKFRNIGDVLLTTPLLKNLKYHYPDAVIDFALNKGTEEMLSLHPVVRKIHIYDRKIKKLSLLKRLKAEYAFAKEIKKEQYDIVINTTEGERGLQLAIFSGAKKIISIPAQKNRMLNKFITDELLLVSMRHNIDDNMDVLRIFNKEPVEKKVEIFWSNETDVSVQKRMFDNGLKEGAFIHVHPVSRWLFKCIDDKMVAKIIDHCQEELKLPVVITAAPIDEEREKVKNIISYCQTEPLNLTGKLSLKETAALNKKSKLYIGVDTAIMHISAANHIPTLAFFGPSASYKWGPWDNKLMKNEYLNVNGDQSMGMHRVLQKNWECVPCISAGCDNSGISDCLIQLNFDEIKSTVKKMLEK
jgi:heptosyltransferase-3